MKLLFSKEKLIVRSKEILLIALLQIFMLPLSHAQEQNITSFLPAIVTQLLSEEEGEVEPEPSDETAYNITLEFINQPTPSIQQAFEDAAQRWENVITGNLSAVTFPIGSVNGCSGQSIVAAGIDDILIQIDVGPIDGLGGTLGNAGPTRFRQDNFLPFAGCMQFDSVDLLQIESRGALENLLIHEMAHVLGFGSLWQNFNLVTNELPGGQPNLNLPQPMYIGTNAIREWDTITGQANTHVPVENGFTNGVPNGTGPGSVNVHWSRTDFDNELMTFSVGLGDSPLSLVTIGSFEDLGYTVDYAAADPFTVD